MKLPITRHYRLILASARKHIVISAFLSPHHSLMHFKIMLMAFPLFRHYRVYFTIRGFRDDDIFEVRCAADSHDVSFAVMRIYTETGHFSMLIIRGEYAVRYRRDYGWR